MKNSGVTSHHPGLADGPIYLDYNATTPVDPRVAEAALPYLTTHFGNPSSGHAYAERPRRALAEARQQLADLIGAQPADIVFTAGGSEADNLAIRGTALVRDQAAPAQIITQASEHPAVLQTCRALQRLHGLQVRYLPVDRDGLVDPATLAEALTPDTVLVSIMAANNETGVLHREPLSIDDCALYPLFSDEVIALMRKLIPTERHDRVAVAVVVKAFLPQMQ